MVIYYIAHLLLAGTGAGAAEAYSITIEHEKERKGKEKKRKECFINAAMKIALKSQMMVEDVRTLRQSSALKS